MGTIFFNLRVSTEVYSVINLTHEYETSPNPLPLRRNVSSLQFCTEYDILLEIEQ